MRSFRLSLVLAACIAAAPLSALAQSAQAADAASAARSELDAQVAGLRGELKAVTDGGQRLRILFRMSELLRGANRVPESFKVLEEIVSDDAIPPGRRSLVATELANAFVAGDRVRGRSFIAKAKALAGQATTAELEDLPGEPAYSYLRAEAEIARRHEGRHEIGLAKMRELLALAWWNFADKSLSAKRRRAAANEFLDSIAFSAQLMVMNNRPQEALSLVNETFHRIRVEPGLSPSPSQLGSLHTGLNISLSSHDDYEAALAASDKALAYYRQAGVPASSRGMGGARRHKLLAALALGRLADFTEDLRLLRQARALNPALAASFNESEVVALQLGSEGRWQEAAAALQPTIDSSIRFQGSENPFAKYWIAQQMMYLLSDPQQPPSEARVARFLAGLAGTDADWGDARFRGAYDEDGALAASIHFLVRRAALNADAAAQAFRAAEILRSGPAQGALADGAARVAAANPELRQLVEQEQLLRFERATQRRTFASAEDRLARTLNQDELVAKRQQADIEQKRKALEETNSSLAALQRDIASRFPTYRELVSPQIPTPTQLGAALRPGEAYIALYPGLQVGHAFVVQAGGRLDAITVPVAREQTRKLVSALRKPFDAGLPPAQAGEPAGFDLSASHAMYRAWIAPIAPHLQGVHTVYLAAGGALSNVPWVALATQPASDFSRASWWGGQVSVVQIPSASALLLTRSNKARPGSRPYFAFADPAFDGQADTGSPGGMRKLRQRAVSDDGFDYRKVPRLPETLDESLALAQALGAGRESVVNGAAATRTRVLKEDLSQSRVVAFATHGLLPGEVPGITKASLAMAYEGRGLEDSLLTIDDVISLRLNADWVVLSACNTGLATGNSGDAFSALVRGFFAAGARTVAATQWAVESESAKQLMMATFRILSENPGASKAHALSQAQREMAAGKQGELYRHPYFWAPYFLSGDAAR